MSACYSNAIPASSLLVNYTRSETSDSTTFSFLVRLHDPWRGMNLEKTSWLFPVGIAA